MIMWPIIIYGQISRNKKTELSSARRSIKENTKTSMYKYNRSNEGLSYCGYGCYSNDVILKLIPLHRVAEQASKEVLLRIIKIELD